MTLDKALDKACNIIKYCKEKHITLNHVAIVPKEAPAYPYQGFCVFTNAYAGTEHSQDMEARRMELYNLKPSNITFKSLISDSWEVVCVCGHTFTTQQEQRIANQRVLQELKEILRNKEIKMQEAFIDREIKGVKDD